MIARRELAHSQLNDYPTSDGRPMAETDWHRNLMATLIATLQLYYSEEESTYVSGNLLVYYEEGNRRRHVSPDVFVVHGVGNHIRPNYLIWEERRGPQMVIELTSSTTRREDLVTKRTLYETVMRVPEYFLFDPREDYLTPSMQGYRLVKGVYQPIRWRNNRLPSRVLGLHLERVGEELRLWNPRTEQRLPTPLEVIDQRNAVIEQRDAVIEQRDAVIERLKHELESLKRR
jgi:Uma2 family endonuclease